MEATYISQGPSARRGGDIQLLEIDASMEETSANNILVKVGDVKEETLTPQKGLHSCRLHSVINRG
jgi:hypothetical protein